MHEQLKLHPNLYALYLGKIDGSLLEITNLEISKQKKFLSDQTRNLPSNAVYSIRLVDRSGADAKEVCLYLDAELKTITEENIFPVIFDARERLWYKGALKNQDLFWTDIYIYDPIEEPGITASCPIFDSQGQFIGATGADLSLTTFSQFLKNQKVGLTGIACLLDSHTGAIILPLEDINAKGINYDVIQTAYQENLGSLATNLVIHKNKEEYLASINIFPLSIGKNWLVAVTAPLSDFFSDILKTQKNVILISLLTFLLASLFVIFFSRRISKPITILSNEIDRITKLDLSSETRVSSNIKELITLDNSIEAMRRATRSFSKYVPKEVVRMLIKKGHDIKLGGEKQKITVMFSDIQGFTSIAEKMPVDQLMNLLEDYFDPVSKMILESEGTIDKYIGDSVMSFWGAPQEIKDQDLRACITALKSHHFLKEFNEQRRLKNLPEFYTRFGLDAGFAIVGNIGTTERINYTAIGDVVNTAARLQATNKIYHTSIIISDRLYQSIKDNFVTRPLDLITVKGKQEPIKIYELIAEASLDPKIGATEDQKSFAALYTKAYQSFEIGHLEEAQKLLEEFITKYPDDEAAKLLKTRLHM
jgi:adenylate cyclase